MAEGAICIVTGGSGYIGGFLIRSLLEQGGFAKIYNFDLLPRDYGDARVVFRQVDARRPITEDIGEFDPAATWIFNLAALCREPGSEPREYFDTNVGAAETVTAYAVAKGIQNIFFTSTMSSYGRMMHPTPESAPQYPETPYGISKMVAEKIHQTWLAGNVARRLIICRPSVIFGPGDKENIPRMIKAVRKGYFVFPGDPSIVKGYGYIYGLVESMAFARARPGRMIIYNYAERDCLSLRGMVNEIGRALGKGDKGRIIRVPMRLLVLAASSLQVLASLRGKPSPFHPVRVRKVGFPTNLKPQYLIDQGFIFAYPFEKALEHWKRIAPHEWS